MNQYKYFVIILYVISLYDIRINGQANKIPHVRRWQQNPTPESFVASGMYTFNATKMTSEVFELSISILLPNESSAISCSFWEVLPAVELAVKQLQQPAGLFENYNIIVEYHETKPQSLHGTLAAFNLYSTRPSG